MKAVIHGLLPANHWLRDYRQALLRPDLTAGLTTAVMLIPQSMAYAMLIGLSPEVGLYASIVPLIVYALLGSSRQLAVGPVAILALMTAASVGAHASPGSADYLTLVILLALMVGVLQLLMGVLRFGFLVNFLSHPVVSGFSSAAAIVIIVGQLKNLLNIEVPNTDQLLVMLGAILRHLDHTHLPTLLVGISSLAFMMVLKGWKPLFPAALTAMVIATVFTWLFDLGQTGIALVGPVPGGLPWPALPDVDAGSVLLLAPSALAIALVGFVEAISVAKVFARKNRYDIQANRELVALGIANITSGLFRAMPVTGGFSRTAVNAAAGGRTGLASIITALVIALVLMFFTSLFYYLPKAVLAATIIMAALTLIDLHEVRHLYRIKRSDLALLAITFIATLLSGVEYGILAGISASLVWFVVRTTRPHTAVLGKFPDRDVFRNIRRHPRAQTIPGILMVRIDAQFYFGNASFLREFICGQIKTASVPVQALIIDAGSVTQLDSSADAVLHEIFEELAQRGIAIYIAEAIGPVIDVMKRSGLYQQLGADHFTWTVKEALELAQRKIAG
ncbi:MAG: solute carrier family 26 protein [Gammaproteobacteria bacterium]|nr:solute carrier family 26 protein [Gammaproteobacteria bacterium]